MPEVSSYCRVCAGLCGVELTLDGGAAALRGQPENPKNLGYSCEVGAASARLPEGERLTRPLKREGGRLREVDWGTAISEIGAALKAARGGDPRAVGLYAGEGLAPNHLGAVRAAAFAAGFGTPNLFSPLAMSAAPMLYATELVLGYPTPLQADVGRSHFVMLLGVETKDHTWGPLMAGTTHTEALAYFRRTRKTKLVVAGPRRSEDADDADQYVPLRPGTELYFLLGLNHLLLNRGFTDEQYLRDHCAGVGRLREWLEPWTAERVSAICGIDPSVLAGVALRFSRAPMAAIAASANLGQSRHGTLAAWAWLVAHALTANLLRPGGLFEAHGLLDLQPLLASFPTSQAPRSRVGDLPALLMQLPGTLLADEILESGEGQLKALIALGDPLAELPQPGRLRRALEQLDLLVVASPVRSPACELADYVLPTATPWERADVQLLDHSTLPTRFVQAVPAAAAPQGEARDEAALLSELFKAARPPLFGGPWGRHLQLTGRYLAGADLRAWVDRALDLADLPPLANLEAMPAGLDKGELDRAGWRVTHAGGRLDLAPDALASAMAALTPPADDPDHPLRLYPRDARGAWLGLGGERPVQVHPEVGLEDGAEVILASPFGAVRARVAHDDRLRPDAVVLPWGAGVDAGELIGGDHDPFTGAPDRCGVPCSVRIAR
jgi:anaerobic selenocysteine-containing dehydrogenase